MRIAVPAAEDALLTEAPGQLLSGSVLGPAVGRYEAFEKLKGNMGLRITTWNGKATLSPSARVLTDDRGSQWHQVGFPRRLAHVDACRERGSLLNLRNQEPILLSAMAGQKDVCGMLRLRRSAVAFLLIRTQSMFEVLEADIVVFQETKIQRKDLRDDMVLVPGWDCYFSLPRHKKGSVCIQALR